jgi:hypothetical protein
MKNLVFIAGLYLVTSRDFLIHIYLYVINNRNKLLSTPNFHYELNKIHKFKKVHLSIKKKYINIKIIFRPLHVNQHISYSQY